MKPTNHITNDSHSQMDYGQVLEALNRASLFELYRLSVAIGNQLTDPSRLAAVKRALHAGQQIEWFVAEENRLVRGKILELRRTRALVQQAEDGSRWTIPFHLINLDGHETEIAPQPARPLDRNRIKVGDGVAFKDRSGQEHFGEVVKLNPKTAAVLVGRTRWRVAYALLSAVIDGERGDDDEASQLVLVD